MAETTEHPEKAGLVAQRDSLKASINQRQALEGLGGEAKLNHAEAIRRESSRVTEIEKRLSEIGVEFAQEVSKGKK